MSAGRVAREFCRCKGRLLRIEAPQAPAFAVHGLDTKGKF
jgi:hypothetical protein